MKAIKFSEKELEFLREQYQDELAQAKEYVDQIIEILNKLGVREKSQKEEPVEIKVYKKRGPKPKVKVAKPKAEPKKRGRKPKIVVPTLEIVPEPNPEKKEGKKKVSKAKAGKKAVKKEPLKKKSSKKVAAEPIAEIKAAPKTDGKKVVKKKAAKNGKKIVEPKSKKVAAKAKVIVEKKPDAKTSAAVESVVTSLLTKAPKKVVKKVVKKKSIEKQRIDEMATSAKLNKPTTKRTPEVKPTIENTPVEPIVPTVEETKE